MLPPPRRLCISFANFQSGNTNNEFLLLGLYCRLNECLICRSTRADRWWRISSTRRWRWSAWPSTAERRVALVPPARAPVSTAERAFLDWMTSTASVSCRSTAASARPVSLRILSESISYNVMVCGDNRTVYVLVCRREASATATILQYNIFNSMTVFLTGAHLENFFCLDGLVGL